MKRYLLSFVALFLISCQNNEGNLDFSDCLDKWNKSVEEAVNKCSELNSRKSTQSFLRKIRKYDFRTKVFQILITQKILTKDVSHVFLIEEYDGDPKRYNIYIRFDKQNTIHHLYHNKDDDSLYLEKVTFETEYKTRLYHFDNWNQWHEWVPSHIKVYSCEEYGGLVTFRFSFPNHLDFELHESQTL